MYDEQHRKRRNAVDDRNIEQRRAIVTDRSAVLQHALGYGKVNEPFLAPPPLPSADTVSSPIVSLATAFQKGPQSLSSTTASTEWAPTADDVVGQRNRKDESTSRRPEATTPMTGLMGKDFLPHPSTKFEAHSNVQSVSRKRPGHQAPAEPARRNYHPDLLGFSFPAAPAPEVKTGSKIGDSMSAAGEDSHVLGNAFTPASPFSPQSIASSEFNIYEDKEDVDAEGESCGDCQSVQNNVQNNVLSDTSLKHKAAGRHDNTPQSLPQCHPTPQPPRQSATQCNVVPNLEDVFDQWLRFGRTNWKGLCLLQPREIPIESVTARTVPCFEPHVPEALREKPVKLFTIAAKRDAAEVKMFEMEVVLESENARRALFNLNDRGPYHETSTANPNIWTILFVRENEKRFLGYGSKGPGGPQEEKTGTGVHVAKKIRRGGQNPDVEAPMLGENSVQHSWQMVAWPSAHASRVLEVLGPVREHVSSDEAEVDNKAQGKSTTAGRAPLAPKIVQVRQNQGTGRVHLKDARAYTEYKATARARVGRNHSASDGVLHVVEDRENFLFPLQRPFCFKVVDAVKGRVEQMSAAMSGLSIGDEGDKNSVLVHEMERLTCLRFQRGGTYPLLTGKGVDLNYWNTFCEYFCKGEVQLEVFSPADGEPVVLSHEEHQLRRGTGASNTSSRGALRTGGRTSDTPVPELMRSAMEHNHANQPESTPLLQRQNTPYNTQNGHPQRGTQRVYQSLPDAQNTKFHQSLHQLPSRSKPSIHPQHSRVTSIPNGSSTVRPQHRDHNRDSSAETIKVYSDADDTTKTPTAKTQAFGREFGATSSRTGPLLRGWQIEMLDALDKNRSPAWEGWTERSMDYDERRERNEINGERIAEEAFTYWPKEVQVLNDDRSLRDGNVMVEHYKALAERRHDEYEGLKKLNWYRQQMAEDDDQLRKREEHFQPLEYMEEVRSLAIQRECERGRMSPGAGVRVLQNSLCVGESQKLKQLKQLQRQQLEQQRRQQEHQMQIQQQLRQQEVLRAQGAYGGHDQMHRVHQQQQQQTQHVPGPYGQSFPPPPFSYGAPPQQQQATYGHVYDHASLNTQNRAQHVPHAHYAQHQNPYTYHGQYSSQSQPTYGHVKQQQPLFHNQNHSQNHNHLHHIGQNFHQQMHDPLPPAIQQQRAPPSAVAAAPAAAGPSYFVWSQVPGAMAAAAAAAEEQPRVSNAKTAMESAWGFGDDDDDEDEDEYFETGW